VQTGVLSGLLRSEEDRKEAVQEGAEQGQPVTVDGSPAAGTTPDGSSELPHGQPAAGDARPGGAAGEGRAGEAGGTGEPKLTTSLSKRTGRDRVGDVAETGAAETTGEAVGTIIQKNVDTKARPTLPYSIQAGLVLSARARPARRGRAAGARARPVCAERGRAGVAACRPGARAERARTRAGLGPGADGALAGRGRGRADRAQAAQPLPRCGAPRPRAAWRRGPEQRLPRACMHARRPARLLGTGGAAPLRARRPTRARPAGRDWA